MSGLRELPHLTFLPRDYEKNTAKSWPLILFLHGASERGKDLNKLNKYGIPLVAAREPDFPFIAVSPQCPTGTYWPYLVENLNDLLDRTLEKYRVDRPRIYLTGLSMGGYGSFYLSMAYPHKFAALAPVCGGATPAKRSASNTCLPGYSTAPATTSCPLKNRK